VDPIRVVVRARHRIEADFPFLIRQRTSVVWRLLAHVDCFRIADDALGIRKNQLKLPELGSFLLIRVSTECRLGH
jgi:hypothetical protein